MNQPSKLVFVRKPEISARKEQPKTFSYTKTLFVRDITDLRLDDMRNDDDQYTLSLRVRSPFVFSDFDIDTKEITKLIYWLKAIYRRQRDHTFLYISSTGKPVIMATMDRVDIYHYHNDKWYEWVSFLYPTIRFHNFAGVDELEISSLFIYTTPNFWSTYTGRPLHQTTTFPNPYNPLFERITAEQAKTTPHDVVITRIIEEEYWYE